MQLNVTFRGMASSDSIRQHLEERLAHLERYLDEATEAHAVFSLDRYLQQADITLRAGRWLVRGHGKTDYLYQSIDEAVERIEAQLKRGKAKRASRRHVVLRAA